jgi:hypothetical protein
MRKNRILIVALLVLFVGFGPGAGAWAQASADMPCDSMSMSMPADDCCGEGMDPASCLSACLAASPALAVESARIPVSDGTPALITAPSFRRASLLAPPDIAPPKPLVS